MCINKENQNPLVSIIMPAYNAEPFIDEAITSVLNQSISDFELIVLDDCSTDHTVDIILKYQQKDARVRLVANEENMGVAKTRNRGLDLCRGKYVALLDSDDYWESQMLEKTIARAVETNADIIYCSYAIVDEQGKRICDDFIVPMETTFHESMVRSVITCSTVLMTGDLAKNNRFPTHLYHEDIALWFQILRDGGIARGVPEVLASYRQRANSRASNKLTSACRRWIIYREHLKLPLVQSIRIMIQYAYYGFKKYKRKQIVVQCLDVFI